MGTPLLNVEDLTVTNSTAGVRFPVLENLSFSLEIGGRLGIAGESGSGKSVLALSILNLIHPPGRIEDGRILFRGEDILTLPRERLDEIRGGGISLVFQDAGSSLTPVYAIGCQIVEVIRTHLPMGESEAKRRALELLDQVGIPSPEQRFSSLPDELSGGMKQRVAIALALASEPDVLIADDPTTAVDVTIQAQILKLLNTLVEERGLALIFISHDFRVVSTVCEEILILYDGRIVERGGATEVFRQPLHPYSRALMDCLPSIENYRFPFPTLPVRPVRRGEETFQGCPFHPRCDRADERCRSEAPSLEALGEEHFCACWHASRNMRNLDS